LYPGDSDKRDPSGFQLQSDTAPHSLAEPAGSFALSDVSDGTADQDTLFGFEWTEADFDWKLAAILALREKLQGRSHRARLGIVRKSGAMVRVPPP
jgi:hypothetical protein